MGAPTSVTGRSAQAPRHLRGFFDTSVPNPPTLYKGNGDRPIKIIFGKLILYFFLFFSAAGYQESRTELTRAKTRF